MKSLLNYDEIIVFDTETTGLNHTQNHIIEFSAVRFEKSNNDYEFKDSYEKLIKINYTLPDTIKNLTGITDLDLQTKGITESLAAHEIYNILVNDSNKTKLFVAYNANFDIGFLETMLNRYHLSFVNKVDFLDVLTVYKDRASYPHKLKDAITHYDLGDKFVNSHRATDDCLATYEVLKVMGAIKDDLSKYVNLFGYNPKYGVNYKANKITYKGQPYNSRMTLYHL